MESYPLVFPGVNLNKTLKNDESQTLFGTGLCPFHLHFPRIIHHFRRRNFRYYVRPGLIWAASRLAFTFRMLMELFDDLHLMVFMLAE